MKTLAITLAVAFSTFVISGCSKSPEEMALSKDSITKEIMRRAATVKRPIVIDKISDPQPMTLHGEKCLTAVAYLHDGSPIYYVAKVGGDGDFLSGGDDILEKVDQEGFNVVSSELPTMTQDGERELTITKTLYVSSTPEDAKALTGLDDGAVAVKISQQKARCIFSGSHITVSPVSDGVDKVVFNNQTFSPQFASSR
jgi:hypothetical protein